MKRIGFTGTQQGMTTWQKLFIRDTLGSWIHRDTVEFHHGDCVGADAEACAIARDLGCRIVMHPPENRSKRAFTAADVELTPKPYLERNHDIVDACELLIAAPKSETEELRSGTWATVRYARKRKGVEIVVVNP